MHGHLPFLISRLAIVARHVTDLYHSATRMIEVGLYSLQMPRPERDDRRRRFVPPSALRSRRKTLRPPKPLLVHYHIFKNAGTSFEWAVQQAFGKHLRLCDAPTADGVLSPKELAQFVIRTPEAKGVFSHQAVLPPPKIRGRAVISSILIRDPIARVRSIYGFERQQARSTPGSMKAKELNFKGYVEWRLNCSPAMFCNYQVYFCSRTKASKNEETTTETHLRRAITNLDLIDVVGTVERYSDWLALAQSILAEFYPPLSLVVSRRNASSMSTDLSHAKILDDLLEDIGSALAERLLECNQLDMRLYQVADALLTRRLAEQHVDISLLNAYAEASQRVPRPAA